MAKLNTPFVNSLLLHFEDKEINGYIADQDPNTNLLFWANSKGKCIYVNPVYGPETEENEAGLLMTVEGLDAQGNQEFFETFPVKTHNIDEYTELVKKVLSTEV